MSIEMAETQEKSQVTRKASQQGFFGELFELVRFLFMAVVVAFFFRTFFFEPFHIPSASMKSTLEIGNYLFVSKFSYGYSRYSLPFGDVLPLPSGRVFFTEPKRGDIIVFKYPGDTSLNYIKRLIGLPGDHIQVKEGVLYINGKAVPKKFVGIYEDVDFEKNEVNNVKQYRETLPEGVQYGVLDRFINGRGDNTEEFIVPEDHYFFMGDNRDNSADSRFPVLDNGVGFVPRDNLVGRAKVIILPEGIHWPIKFYDIANRDRSAEKVMHDKPKSEPQ